MCEICLEMWGCGFDILGIASHCALVYNTIMCFTSIDVHRYALIISRLPSPAVESLQRMSVGSLQDNTNASSPLTAPPAKQLSERRQQSLHYRAHIRGIRILPILPLLLLGGDDNLVQSLEHIMEHVLLIIFIIVLGSGSLAVRTIPVRTATRRCLLSTVAIPGSCQG